MSLRFALLGLLAERPSSGYELERRFAEGIGSFAWSASHSQIYPELARLVGDGLVVVVAEGARGRRDHAITSAGREALRSWLLGAPDSTRTVRNEFVLRLFLLSALDRRDAVRVLDGTERFVTAELATLTAAQQEMVEEGVPPGSGPELAAEFGVRSYRATLEWVAWARGRLEG